MVSPKQKQVTAFWQKYKIALIRLDRALDKLNSIPKGPVQATLTPLGGANPAVEIPGFDDQTLPKHTFVEDGVAKDFRDLKPETVHQLFQEGQLPKDYDDLILLEERNGYIHSKAITSRGESKVKMHEPSALSSIFPDYKNRIGISADNKEPIESESGFGTQFPKQPNKGDTFLRVDQLPTKLFKFNGLKWIELDKERSSSYSYNDEYITYLQNMVETGQYDPELLTDTERDQVEELIKNRKLDD
jgi:hypothetical protein